MPSRYAVFLKDKEVARWHRNVARGSQITADVYLRRLGSFCISHKTTPERLERMNGRALFRLLLDTVSEMEAAHAGSYIHSCLKAVKSWLAYNNKQIPGKILIRGARERPTLRDERVPSQEELRRILLAADERTRAICVLIAHSGLRPEVIGDYKGTDGLRLRDIPELQVDGPQISFSNVPAMIRVRTEMSKARHEYFSFIGEEGCQYLKAYLEHRMRRKEALGPDSPLVNPLQSKKSFVCTVNVGDAVRKAIRKAGFRWRPYVLRSFFATQLMMAESKGLMIRDYRVFFMGHKGDIEAVYTLNKRMLPPEVVEQMRASYGRSQQMLETVPSTQQQGVLDEFRRQLLLVAGFKADEIISEHLSLDDDSFQKLVRERLTLGSTAGRHMVVTTKELAGQLEAGAQFVASLPNGKAVVRLP